MRDYGAILMGDFRLLSVTGLSRDQAVSMEADGTGEWFGSFGPTWAFQPDGVDFLGSILMIVLAHVASLPISLQVLSRRAVSLTGRQLCRRRRFRFSMRY